MLTRCPRCKTSFRVLAEHLRAARGRVQCGRCYIQFDALENLYDPPPAAPPPEAGPAAATEGIAGPPPSIPSPGPAVSAGPEFPVAAPVTPEPQIPEEKTQAVVAESGEPSLGDGAIDWGREETESDRAIIDREEHGEGGPATPVNAKSGDDILLRDIPRVVIDRDDEEELEPAPAGMPLDLTPAPAPGSRWWGVGAALLVVLLVGQYVWFEREALVGQFPELRPVLEQLCKGRACELPPRRDLTALKILARDVREHPRFKDALLVNATLMNEAAFAQPFPVVELSLFDHSGHVLGMRRFTPAEYLDSSIAIADGIKPQQPVYIVMEIAGVGDEAVSFEFKFL